MLQTPVASSYIPFSGTGKKPSDGENTPFRTAVDGDDPIVAAHLDEAARKAAAQRQYISKRHS